MRLARFVAATNTPVTVTLYEGATARWSTTIYLKSGFRSFRLIVPSGVKAAFAAWSSIRVGITSTEEVRISNFRTKVLRSDSAYPLTARLQLMQNGVDIEGAVVTLRPDRNGSVVTGSLQLDSTMISSITTTGAPNYTASNLQFKLTTDAGTDVVEKLRVGQMTFDASTAISSDVTVTVAVKGAATTYRTETFYYSTSSFRTDKFRLTDAEKASVITNSDLGNLKLDVTTTGSSQFSNFRISQQDPPTGGGGGSAGDGLWKDTGISYYPGPSVAITRDDIVTDGAWQQKSWLSWAINSPKVVGLGSFLYWGDIQTGSNPVTYNWTYVDRIIDDVLAAGKKIFFRIEPKTFSELYHLATPLGMRTMNVDFFYYGEASDGFSAGTSPDRPDARRCACIWHDNVRDAFVELWRQFALRYAGTESNFYLLSTMETSVRNAAKPHPWSGWTEPVWIAAYNQMMAEIRTQMGSAWPIGYSANWISESLAASARDCILQNNLYITGPDVASPGNSFWLPTTRSSAWNTIHRPLNGLVPIFQELQDGVPTPYHDYEISPATVLEMISTPVTEITASLPYGGMPMQGLHLTPNQYRGATNTYHFEPDWTAALDAWNGSFPFVIPE